MMLLILINYSKIVTNISGVRQKPDARRPPPAA
jgi:hypothetical protein